MGKLIDKYIEWAFQERRWPLVFIVGLLPLFSMVRNYFELSFRETFHHWCFLAISGILLILSGTLFIVIVPHKVPRVKSGLPLALIGGLILALSFFRWHTPELTNGKFVVAIARFTPISLTAEDQANNIAHRIEQKLIEKQRGGLELEIRRVDAQVRGADMQARQEAAMALGRSVKGCAHVVVWGEVRMDEGELFVQPNLTIVRPFQDIRIQDSKFGEIVSRGPTHLILKERLSTGVADIVVLVYGVAFYEKGDWDNTISVLKHLDAEEAHLLVGTAYLVKGDYRNSIVALEQAVGQGLYDEQLFNNLFLACLKAGRPEDAKKYLEKSLAIAPENTGILSNYALFRMSRGDFEKAMDSYRTILATDDNPIARSNLAFCLFELGRVPEAVAEWEHSLDSLDAWNRQSAIQWQGLDASAGLAVGYYTIGQIEKSESLYRHVISQNSDYRDPESLSSSYFWPEKIKTKAGELIRQIDAK